MASLNPIIPGFAPDPSICLISETFFLVNSTFHIFPGLPIYASKDLVNWQHIGNAINRPGQLSLRPATTFLVPWDDGNVEVATGGLYAPTIRHHNGTTYIICTNVVHGSTAPGDGDHTENFIVHTTDIWSNEWSDPVYYEFEGIDPSIFFDDDGKAYVQGTQMPEFQIFNMEVNLKTGKMPTPPKLIWEGCDKRYTEGPHLYKKDGWYYLLCAEGGTFSTHMVSMARSRSLWGPFETHAKNPIWTAHGTDNYIQHTGHADLFQDLKGDWWIVMLGVRLRGSRFVMGRESFLSSVEWPEHGWPVVAPIEPAVRRLDVSTRTAGPPITARDGVDWVYLRDPILSNYQISGTTVELTATAVDLSAPMDPVTFVGKRQRVLQGQTSAVLSHAAASGTAGLSAGLALFKDEHRYIAIGYDFDAMQVFQRSVNRAKKYDRIDRHDLSWDGVLALKVTYSETEYKFFYSVDAEDEVSEQEWTPLGTIDTADISGFDFTGPILGVFAIGNGKNKIRVGDVRIQ